MSKQPLISVIIPAYNHENYVQETIKSLIDQSYQNIELIIIDDGSKDSTWQKILDMEDVCKKRFSNVIFKTKPNGGTCETLNLLLKEAKGEFVYLIASDDLAKPHAIEKEYDFLSQNPDYALVVGDNEIIDGQSVICYWDKKRNNVYDVNKAKFLTFGAMLKYARRDVDFNSTSFGTYASLFRGNYIPNGYLIRKSIFDKIGNFTKEAPLEDLWLHLQISKYSKIKYIDEILFSYRWHSSNTVKQRERVELMTLKTINYERKLLKSLNLKECLNDVSDFMKNGIVLKIKGIRNIFQIIKSKNVDYISKSFKLFGITLFEIKKPY